MGDVNVTFSIPVEVRDELARRCQEFGVDQNKLVAALLLRHLWEKWQVDIGWDVLVALELWESGSERKRQLPAWEICVPSDPDDPDWTPTDHPFTRKIRRHLGITEDQP